MSILGADISGWQPGNVNLTGLDFIYVKSTQGMYKVNANHDAQVNQARAAGLVVGHYHFPAWGNPVSEAQAFVSANGALPGEFLVLDIEDSPQTPWPANPVPWCCAFVDEVHRLTGLWCLNYCGPNVRHTWDWAPLAQRGGGLISPEYNNNGPSDPAPWAGTTMWQNANTNISGGDSDVFFGDRAALTAYGTPGGVTPDASTITPILEDELMAALDEPITTPDGGTTTLRAEIAWLAKNFADVRALVGNVPAQAADKVLNAPITKQGGGSTTPATEFSWLGRNFANVPATVWNQNVGTGNAAGVLNHIDQKPAGATAAVAQVDVEALAAKLATTLPPAVVAQLATQLAKL